MCVCMSACGFRHVSTVPTEVKKGGYIPRDWNFKRLGASLLVWSRTHILAIDLSSFNC